MIKRLVIAFVVLVVVGGGLVGFNVFRDQAIKGFFANRPRPTVTVSAHTVEAVTWRPTIEAIGTVSAQRGVDLAVEVAGVVEEIAFRANDQVATGQVLLQLKDRVEQADLGAAEAEAGLARRNLERAQTLGDRGIGAKAAVDTATAEASAAESRVVRLRAVLEQKTLEAPFAGTIGIPRVDIGQYVSPGTVVATLQGLDSMRVDFTTPEQALPDLEVGQGVLVGAEPDDLGIAGEITGIDPKINPNMRLVSVRASVRASVGDPSGTLTPGQFVRIRVVLPEDAEVIAVPQTALVASLYGDYVYVIRQADAGPGGTGAGEPGLVVRQAFVRPGRRSGGMVEILEGVAVGDRVVSAGQNRLTGGTPVKVAEPAATEARVAR
jgi:membrane fusion protein (multidrug efflux system)